VGAVEESERSGGSRNSRSIIILVERQEMCVALKVKNWERAHTFKVK